MENAVEIKNLSVTLGRDYTALKSINLSLPKGKITGVIGPSGAGKTTLIRAIVGQQRITRGTVTVLDLPAGSASLRSQVSYMTQELSIYQDLTVWQNLDYFAKLYGIKRVARQQTIKDVLKTLDLSAHSRNLVKDLSGGQKQRVSLAIAMLNDADLLVLDEPTVGQDPVLRENLWQLFRSLASQSQKTIIISSHVMDEASRCDNLVLIRNGQVIAHDTPEGFCKKTGVDTVEAGFIKLAGGKK